MGTYGIFVEYYNVDHIIIIRTEYNSVTVEYNNMCV